MDARRRSINNVTLIADGAAAEVSPDAAQSPRAIRSVTHADETGNFR
jgi:hypothetical protein